MGAMLLSRQELLDSLIEIAGFKAGVVITEDEATELVEGSTVWQDILEPGYEGGRIRSEEFEEAVALLLFNLGNIPSPNIASSSIQLYHKLKDDPARLAIYQGVQKIWIDMGDALISATPSGGLIDPSPFIEAAYRDFGLEGTERAIDLLRGINHDLHRSAWSNIRSIEWKDEIELKALFESEALGSMHGQFFDQRFIDYLNQNFDEIGNIHWRQFEGLAGEFFTREGFQVDMGPGRNDDGIDLRIFPADSSAGRPPLTIVQCKRQKEKIGKALIKSVYADVLHEGAQSGLIVTSSELAPGAAALRTARGYPIEAADRTTLRQWVQNMRSGQR